MVRLTARWISRCQSNSPCHALAGSLRVCCARTRIKTRNNHVARMVIRPSCAARLDIIVFARRHYGVLLLYGQHLALNHLVAQNELHLIIGQNLLDQSTTNTNPQYVREGIRLNLHCWHTDDRFSKFAFKMGHYNRTELEKFRNDTTVQAYVSPRPRHLQPSSPSFFSAGNANGARIEIHVAGRAGSLRTEQFSAVVVLRRRSAWSLRREKRASKLTRIFTFLLFSCKHDLIGLSCRSRRVIEYYR